MRELRSVTVIHGDEVEKKVKLLRCCLCSKKVSPEEIVTEERPTAEDGSVERWFYCPACWSDLWKLRQPPGTGEAY